MTNELAMTRFKQLLERIATGTGYTDTQLKAAMVLAMAEGVDRLQVRNMAMAVGLCVVSTS